MWKVIIQESIDISEQIEMADKRRKKFWLKTLQRKSAVFLPRVTVGSSDKDV